MNNFLDDLKNFNIGPIELKIGNKVIYKENKLNRSLYNEGFLITPFNGVQLVSTKPILKILQKIKKYLFPY